MSKLVYPDGKVVTYEYDLLDQMTSVIDSAGAKTEYTYNEIGQLTKTKRPNGTYTEIEYNNEGQLIKLQNKEANGTIISSFAYEYNAKGDITKETKSDGTITVYEYDKLGQLTRSLATKGTVITDTIYGYDKTGNRIMLEIKSGETTATKETYNYNNLNQLTGKTVETTKDKKTDTATTEYIYDINGNLIKELTNNQIVKQYSYDTEDRLKAVRDGKTLLLGALYDGDGERVFTLNGSQKYVGVKHTGNNSDGTKHDLCDHKNKNCTDEIYFPYSIEDAKTDKYELREYVNDINQEYTNVLSEYTTKKGELDTTYTYGLQRESYNSTTTKNQANYYMYDGAGNVANIYGQKKNEMIEYTYSNYGQTTTTGKTENQYTYSRRKHRPKYRLAIPKSQILQPRTRQIHNKRHLRRRTNKSA